MQIRVAQILGCPVQSGAGRGTLALHEGLLEVGIGSRLLGRIERDLPSELHGYPASWFSRARVSLIQRVLDWRLRRRYGRVPPDFMPVSVGLDIHTLPAYRDADIIHVQWVNARNASPRFWEALSNESRPVVWSLRDMWPFTGGCHFSMGCARYKRGCGKCPQLAGLNVDSITAADAAFKARHVNDNMTFIAISRHTAELARQSMVLRGRDIRVIPNSLLLQRFTAIDKQEARQALDLPEDKFIIATGAAGLSNIRKGAAVLRELLQANATDQNCHWAVFGRDLEAVLTPIPENCSYFGLIRDDKKLNQLYSAADVFAMPSLYETFGKTTVEAMASGTAVIAFDDTPASEMLDQDETGYLVPRGDAQAFVARLNEVRQFSSSRLREMGLKARREALDRFSTEAIVSQHTALYRELLDAARS